MYFLFIGLLNSSITWFFIYIQNTKQKRCKNYLCLCIDRVIPFKVTLRMESLSLCIDRAIPFKVTLSVESLSFRLTFFVH